MKIQRLAATLTAAVLGATFALPAAAQSKSPDSWDWRFEFNIYLPGIDSTTSFEVPGGGNVNAETDPSGYLSKLKATFMGALQVRRGPWSMSGDVLYLDLGDLKTKVTEISGPGGIITAPVNVNTGGDLKGFIGTFLGGYTVMRDPGSYMDVVGGARYARLKTKLEYELTGPTGGVPAAAKREATKDFWDGVIGIRGTSALGGNWDLRYYGDVGAGSSKSTWQVQAGVGYRFGWGDAVLSYRHLAYKMDSDRPISDMSFSGPQFALGWNF